MEENKNNTVPARMSLSLKWGKIRVYHDTIVTLNEPKYIRFLLNPKTKKLAVQVCKKKNAESFSVPKYAPDNWVFRINSIPMLRIIWKICGWDEQRTYRLSGEVFGKYDLVEFDLTQGIALDEGEE